MLHFSASRIIFIISTNWTNVPDVNSPSSSNYLYGVTALATTNVWAVGGTDGQQTIIEHWNGSQWKAKLPKPGLLRAVSAVSADDVWAVGQVLNSGGSAYQTLTEHWNGTSWNVVPSPNVGSGSNQLYGVTKVATNDVWAVGSTAAKSGALHSLIEHWNGTAWSIVASPNLGIPNLLSSVAAVSTNDVWAVGTGPKGTLTEHWNGTRWSVVASPNPGSGSNQLTGVTTVSTKDVWAVGYYSSGGPYSTLIEHWNGTSWNVVTSPNSGSGKNVLSGVAATSATSIWAVGNYVDTTSGATLTLIEHWNGTAWSIVSSPNQGNGDTELNGVTAVPGSKQAWAVGDGNVSSSQYFAFTDSYC